MANKRRAYGPTVADVFSTLTDAQRTAVAAVIVELEKSRTLYVVTADGIKHSHGSSVYLIGVYDIKEKAQKVCDENKDWKADITEITMNEICPLTKDKYGDYSNKHLLGGYDG